MTTFGDGLFQYGGMPVGGLPYAHLLGPKGKVLFVAPYRTAASSANSAAAESSDGNDGSFLRPLKTISAAYAKCNGNRGEIIYVLGYSNTAADITDDWSTGMTWSKSFVHLIGLVPPTHYSQRARIAQTSTATGISPLLTVSGHGNVFANLQIFQGVDDATSLVNVSVTGQHNVFDSVHIAGIGNATQSATGAASLKIDGGAENVFRRCTIGLDTTTRDADVKGEIWFDGAATRNDFIDCHITAFVSAAGYQFLTVEDATGIDRVNRFKNCLFTSKSANKAIDLTTAFDIPAISQGALVLENSYFVSDGGTTAAWDSSGRGIIWNNSVAAAASGAGGEMTNL
jgi:hypothetical protein